MTRLAREENIVTVPSPSPRLSRGLPDFAPTMAVGSAREADEPSYLRVDVAPSGGVVDLPDAAGHVIAAGEQLVCDLFPVAGAVDRYAATAVSVDVVFDGRAGGTDDGTRDGAGAGSDPAASETAGGAGARDQYGVPLDPAAQADARRMWVDQWNRRTVDLSAFAGRRVAGIRLSFAPEPGEEPAGERTVFVDAPKIERMPPGPADLLERVDTRRGTHSSDRFSRGNTAPIVTMPHGGVFALPMTDASAGNWPYRYQVAAPRLEGFATSHIPSPWIGDRGVFQLMPSPHRHPRPGRRERSLPFDRSTEKAGPHEYRVELEGVSVSMTAARHAIGLRLRSHGDELSVIVDHLGYAVAASWHGTDGDGTDGDGTDGDGDGGDTLHLAVRLRDGREGPDGHEGLDHFVHAVLPGVADHTLRLADGELRGSVRFVATDVDIVVGVSTVDAAQAAENARAAGTIDEMRDRSARLWRDVLARVEIADADAVSDDVLASIAGSLGRVFSYPNAHDEPSPSGPRYRSPVDNEVREGSFSSNNGFWDTYRTAWPMLGLLTPRTAGALADGFVRHFDDAGWVARWSAPGPVDCMTGTTSDTVFAALDAAGVPFDTEGAYRSALRHATVPATDARVGRTGLRPGIFRGFVDTDTHEGMSWTLDNAINDASAARLARSLERRTTDAAARDRLVAEGDYLARRALGYRSVFRPGMHRSGDLDLGFFVGRRADGSWRVEPDDFDPAEWGHDYTETNAWGTMFTAPHDGAGLAALHGGAVERQAGRGEDALGAALDEFFATPETADPARAGSYGFVIHEMSEARDVRMGMLGLSNQPAHHIPFMYCFAGRHDDAHRIVVEARDRLFVGSDLGQGYPGDEDNGEMSAWYLFAVLGLYPLVPGSGEFVLTPPLLPRVVLRPEGRERPLEIVAVGAGRPFIRSVRIDGRPWRRIAVPAEMLRTAERIEVELSETPTGWAAASRPSSFSTEFATLPLVDLLAVAPGTVADDTGAVTRSLAPGGHLDLHLAEPARLGLYTVTLAGAPAPLPVGVGPDGHVDLSVSWRLLGRTIAGEWIELDERVGEVFDIASQTRPFRTKAGRDAVVTAIRFEAVSEIELAQLEAFAPAPDAVSLERVG